MHYVIFPAAKLIGCSANLSAAILLQVNTKQAVLARR